MAFKDIVSGTNPLATDVQQIINALQGTFDVGALSLFVQIAAPGAPTVADSGLAGNPNGAYLYKVTLCTGLVESDSTVRITGETQGGTTSATLTVVSHQISLTAIPTGPAGTVARRIYRTAAGGADGTQKLVTTINDNVTTVYTDNVADASLGAAVPTGNTTGTTLTLARDPVGPLEAATKGYVDNIPNISDKSHRLLIAALVSTLPFGTSGTGNISWQPSAMGLITGTTAGSLANVRAPLVGPIANFYDVRSSMSVVVARYVGDASAQKVFRIGVGAGPYNGSDTTKGFGFKVIGDTIYAWNSNGTAQTTSAIGTQINTGNAVHLYAVLTPGVKVEFYVDGMLTATHTTNLPTGSETVTFWSARIENGTDAANHTYYVTPPVLSY